MKQKQMNKNILQKYKMQIKQELILIKNKVVFYNFMKKEMKQVVKK